MTQRLLDRLFQAGYPDAAFQLAESSTRYSPEFRFNLAFNAKFYEKAFTIASSEYERYKGCVLNTYLLFLIFLSSDARSRARLLSVGQASMDVHKYDLARKAFELANDPLALLNLYVVNHHKVFLCTLALLC